MNIGTTVESVAVPCSTSGLKIITNNLNVAPIFSGREELSNLSSNCGASARGYYWRGNHRPQNCQFKVITRVASPASDEDGTLLDFDYREVRGPCH